MVTSGRESAGVRRIRDFATQGQDGSADLLRFTVTAGFIQFVTTLKCEFEQLLHVRI